MAVEIATAYVSILPSARGFGRSLSGQLDGEMSAAGASAGQHASMSFGKALTVGIALAATAAAVGLTALGKAAAGYGLKIASQNEQAAVSFETLLGSVEASTAMINDLKKFAAETPFEFPELQQAANTLLTTGVAANKIIPIMRTLGDVTSGMGTGAEGVQRAMVALQQMNAAGRILAEDLNQLRDAGIPVFDLLAGATGRTKEELSAMAQSGKLGRQELEQLMTALETGKGLEKFTGLMEKQSKTLNGLISTLKDNLGQGLAEAMAPAVVAIKAQLPGISTEIANGLKILGPILTRVVDLLINTVGKLIPSATPVLEAFGNLFADVLTGVAELVQDMLPFLAFLGVVLADTVGGAVTELLPELRNLVKAFGPLAVMATRLVGTFAAALAPAFSALLKAATPLVAMFTTGLSRAFDQLAKIDVSGIFEALVPVFDAVAVAFVPLADVFVFFANEVGAAIVDMLPGLVIGFSELALAFLPMLPDITRLVRDLLPLLVEMFIQLAPDALRLAAVMIPLADALFRLKLIWNDMLLRILTPFIPLIMELATVVLPLLEKIVVPIVDTFVRWVGVLSETTAGMALLIGLLTVGIGFKLIAQLVISTIQGYNLLTVLTLVNAAYAGQAAAAGAATAAAEAGTVLTFWQKVSSFVLGAAKANWIFQASVWAVNIAMSPWFLIPVLILAIVAALVIAYNDVEWFHQAVDALWDSFQVGIEWIKELVKLLFAGDFSKAGEMVSEMGGRIVDGLANLGNLIRDKVGEWALAALEGLKTLGSAMLGYLTGTLLPLLGNALLGYARVFWWWISEAIPYVIKGLVRMWLALAVWLYTTAIPWLLSAGWDLIVAFVGWIKEAIPAAHEQLAIWLTQLGGWITGFAVPWLKWKAETLKWAFLLWIQQVWPLAVKALTDFLVNVASWYYGTLIPWLIENGLKLLGAILGWLVDVVPTALLWLGKLLVAFGVWYYGTAVPWLLSAGWALLGAMLHFLQEAPGWISEGLTMLLGNLGGWIATAAVWLAEKALQLGAALWGWLQEAVPAALEQLGVWLSALGGWITDTALPAIGEKAKELAAGLWGWITEALPQALAALGTWLQGIGVWIAETAVPWLISKGASLLIAMLLWAVKLTWEMPMYLAKLLYVIGEWIIKTAPGLSAKAQELGTAFIGWLIRLPLLIPGLLAKLLLKIGEWIVHVVPWLWMKAFELNQAFLSWIINAIASIPGLLWGFMQSIGDWILNTGLPWLIGSVLELKNAITHWIEDAQKEAPKKLEEWGNAILEFIGGLPKKITDAAKNMFIGISNAFIAAINWLIRTWNDLKLEIPKITIYGVEVGGFTLETNNVDEIMSISSFAKGGRPPRNRPSLVGELGPELFVPDAAGTVIPNNALGAGSGGFNIGHLEVTGQDRPTDTAFAIRSELHWLSMVAGAA